MGGDTQVVQPAAPAAPSVTSSIQDWVQNYPAVFALQQQYAPLEAQQQIALAQQYAQPFGQALKTAQEAMYPQETAMTNTLNQQAQQGMTSEVPDWMRQEYLSGLNANLGTNVGSPIGADYASRGLLQQKQDWQNYYRNMGLSITGRQPIYQAQPTSYTNQASNFTPSSVMGYNSQNYGSYSNLYGNMYNTNAQTSMSNPWANIGGSVAGGVAGMGTMGLGKNLGWW